MKGFLPTFIGKGIPLMTMLQRLADALKTTFHGAAGLAGAESKVIVRQRKFTATTLAQSFILALLENPHANSQDIASMAGSLGTHVTPEAVQQRYSPALNRFFRTLFEKMTSVFVGADEQLAPLLSRFTEVKLMDSTVIALPASMAKVFPGCGGTGNSNSAALKLQTELDLRNGGIECVQLEDGKSPDQATNRLDLPPQAGSLQIADLGYFSFKRLKLIEKSDAFYVSRLLSTTNIQFDGKACNVIEFLRVQDQSVFDAWVQLGSNNTISCRVIVWRVPEEVAACRRSKVRKQAAKKGRQPTQATLDACDWNMLITNLPLEKLSLNEAIVLYRMRWQIELLFKRWKSYCGIGLLDGQTDEITMTRLWARLCGALIQQWIVAYCGWTNAAALPSFSKIAKAIRHTIGAIASSFSFEGALEIQLERFRLKMQHLCRRMKRNKKPSFIELLRDTSKLEYSLT